jgi:hypothetical protein
MSRKIFILLLGAVITAGLAAQAVAEHYNFTSLASELVTGRASNVVMSGTTGFELSGYGVTALDLTEPAIPVVLGKTYTPGLSYTGDMYGNYLVIADADYLTIVDVSTPAWMWITGQVKLPATCRDLTVAGNYAYCAVENSGLAVVDLNDVYNPQVVATLALSGMAYQIDAALGRVFVAIGTAGMVIVDVTNPLLPVYEGSVDTPGLATGVAVHADSLLVAVADGTQGVALIDVNSFTNPVLLISLPTLARAVDVTFGALFAAVSELDTDGDGALEFVNYIGQNIGNYRTAGGPLTTTLSGNLALICQQNAGIEIVDITDPASPDSLTTYMEPAGGPRSLVRVGNLAYVANYDAGMTIMDMTTLTAPVTLATVPTSLWCYDVAVVDTYAYAMDFNGTLNIIGISNPSAPNLISTYMMDEGTRSMVYNDSYLYVGKYNAGLFNGILTYNLVGTAVTLLDIDGIAADVKGITVQNGKLFASATDSGVYIYDLTNPVNPAFLGRYATTGRARMTAVNGNNLYVAAEGQGLVVLDITDPANPVLVGTPYSFDGEQAMGVTFSDNKVFVAHHIGGVTVLDVTDPANPVWFGRTNTPSESYEAFVWDESHMLVCDTYSLEVYEMTVVGVIPNPGSQTPETFTLRGTYPNPFNATTMISFALPISGRVELAVFDAMGRNVAQPFSGNLEAGEHQIPFNAEALTSGVYFLHVSSPWGEQSGKMVLLK